MSKAAALIDMHRSHPSMTETFATVTLEEIMRELASKHGDEQTKRAAVEWLRKNRKKRKQSK